MVILTALLLLTAANLAVSRKTICPTNATSCSACITANVKCAWCSELAREVRRNRPITPQMVKLHLRRGAKANIPFRVKAKTTPVIMQFRYPRGVRVTVQADCMGFQWKKKIAKCRTTNGNVVNVTMTVHMKRCLPKPKKIKVIVGSFKKRPLKVLLTSACRCDCEKPEEAVVESTLCHSQGTHACGLCLCNEGRYGRHCECQGTGQAVGQCIGRKMTAQCSGRGDCICGMCHCNSISSASPVRYTGRFCECDDTACAYHQGQLCGGRGRCSCGQCICNDGFSGEDCSNDMSVDKCKSPATGLICNGHGQCVSNQCMCEPPYAGVRCEECPTCPGQCQRLKDCVMCFAFVSGAFNQEECRQRCEHLEIHLVDDVAVMERGGPNYRMCLLRDEDNCFFKFAYAARGRMRVRVERTRMCP
ncbi:integrin beta-PS-like isoform X5 [Haliotis asinina]|uniref:integrin beta-PS-like isoform X5 n=1 Tax=Haliotis asinina TaxID=109174 RepID=UPI0035319D24